MIYGIEQTTDRRYPETKIVRFASERAALKWAKDSGGFAWPGAADPSLPPSQSNFHRRIREVYSVSDHAAKLRARVRKRLDGMFDDSRRRANFEDCLATEIFRVGVRIEAKEG